MAVTELDHAAGGVGGTARWVGPDVVRAVALIGVVVMNYHGYLLIAGGQRGDGVLDDFFDPWRGPLGTRFAATFVLVAGVGVTLLTRRAIGDPRAESSRRWTLLRRGLLLYVFGLVFDELWPGTILPFYGAMFVVGAVIFTWRSRWVLTLGAAAAVAAAGLAWWRLEQRLDGRSTAWMTDPPRRSPRGLALDVFVNGTHPLLPWLAFLCTGIVLGRLVHTGWWRPAAIIGGLSLFTFATGFSAAAATGDRALVLASNDPFDRGLLYTASALGTALAAFGLISLLAERFAASAAVDVLRRAGQMSLTLYIAHALVYELIVVQIGAIEPGGLGVALTFATLYWIAAIAAGAWHHRRFGIGPAEWVYRRASA